MSEKSLELDEDVEVVETADELFEALGVPQGFLEDQEFSGVLTLTHRGPDGEVKEKKEIEF